MQYRESLLEEFIKDYPHEFLGEELALFARQPRLSGYRPDLIFTNSKGAYIIVELQINALDKVHLYKSLEYRDLLKAKYKLEDVEVIIFCNDMPQKFRPILKTHNVRCIAKGIDECCSKIKELNPEIEILLQLDPETRDEPEYITANKILRMLKKKASNETLQHLNATVFFGLVHGVNAVMISII